MAKEQQTYGIDIAGVHRELELFEVKPGLRIAILNILGDTELVEACAVALSEKLKAIDYDVLVTAEAKSIPLAHALSVTTGKPYVILRKSYKPYMGDAIQSETLSITTGKPQTLFLDEIGSIDMEVQVKLLRVLQEREFERVGGYHTIKTDIRIIAATSKNLEEAVDEGTFSSELYYRLNVFPVYMPPLRERKTDMLLLADFFLEKYSKENQKDIRRLSTPAIDMLMQYHWPGNVRELENCIERAVLLCEDSVIHSYHLPPTLQTGEESDTVPALSLEESVTNLEREMIIDALKNTHGNMVKAAQLLHVTDRKFTYKVKKYEVDYRKYR